MAIIKGTIKMTGGIENMSFYSIAGSDRVIARMKGGPDAHRMKVGKEFAGLRKHQKEWAACVLFSKGIHLALGETYHLADYNVCPGWNGMGKELIKLDTVHPVGERNLCLSQYREALQDYPLNHNYPFNTVLRISTDYEVNKKILQATIQLPGINTEMNLLNIQKLPYFRIIMSLGIVSDILYKPDSNYKAYEPTLTAYNGKSASTISDWFSTEDIIDPQTLTVQLGDAAVQLMTADTTVLLGIGVEFGKVSFGGQITPVKRAGCAKILACV